MTRTDAWPVRLALGGIIAALLAGCPAPVLQVTPLAVSFEPGINVKSFRIQNTGAGTLNWAVSESLPWLTISQKNFPPPAKQGTLQGTATNTDVVFIEMTLDRTGISETGASGEVVVNSDGGSEVVSINVAAALTAQLQVSQNALDFGIANTQSVFTITNGGAEALTWTIAIPPDAPWLSATPRQATLSSRGAQSQVGVNVNRAGLAAGTYTSSVNITSNGGNAAVAVTMRVPSFTVQPGEIDFGRILTATSQILSVANNGFDPIPITIVPTTFSGGNWLSVDPVNANVSRNAPGQFAVRANPGTLVPGRYLGQLRVTNTAAAEEQIIPVSMELTGFSVSTNLIDFGLIGQISSQTFTVNNAGGPAIPYSITVPPVDQIWLSVAPAAGNVQSQDLITVTINPLAVEPGAYESTISVLHEGVQESIIIRMARPKPAKLTVSPSDIDLGVSGVDRLIGIWNDGVGTINWTIDTTTFPDWLSITPVNLNGIASGTVSGSVTNTVTLRIDRDLVPAGEINFSHTFQVQAAGDSTDPVTIQVRAQKPLVPDIEIISDGVDQTGVPFLNFPIGIAQKTIFIRNNGNGRLDWSFQAERPQWLSSIAPESGAIPPGSQQTITISVDRATLTFVGAQITISINSNDPDESAAPLLVEVQVERRVSITGRPQRATFGPLANSGIVEVANNGDPGTTLLFQVTSTKDWLSVFPETGSSVAPPPGVLLDFRPLNVTVDRTLLKGTGAAAKLIVRAYTIENGQPVPLPNVEPFEFEIGVDASPLTIESAPPRLRIPSLARFVLLMRNIAYEALPIPESRLNDIGNLFQIFENDTAIELIESNQFLRSGNRLRTNVLILLDYSNSMAEAARKLVQDGQLPANTADPLQTVYEQTISRLIDELPVHYRIALAVFNERGVGVRLIPGSDGLPLFTRDRVALQARLLSIDVNDNGATELVPALSAAANILVREDLDVSLFSFDDADVRAIIAVTDGRLTTPPGSIPILTDEMAAGRVRLFSIGWGDNVQSDPLVRISTGTGGHYYPTATQPTGQNDAFGRPIRRPLLSELFDWCDTDPIDPCDQSVSRDLASQVVLSYVTLNEESGITARGDITFDDPNDGPLNPGDPDSACLTEQGNITGGFQHSQLDYAAIAGDPRLGQISLYTTGVNPGGVTEIVARGEYMPRNVNRFRFQISAVSTEALAINVVPVTAAEGGLIPDWTLSGAPPEYVFSSPNGAPLAYADFGDMFRIQVTGATAGFQLNFEVVEPERTASADSKFFTHPDTLAVTDREFIGSAFPRPGFLSTPAPISTSPFVIDLGTTAAQAQIFVFNIGGSWVRPGITIPDPDFDVGLHFLAGVGPGSNFFFINDADLEGFATSTLNPVPVTVFVDRTLPPGTYVGTVEFDFDFGYVNFGFEGAPITIRYTVLPPSLVVTPNALNFASGVTEQPLTLRNDGQGLLRWTIDTTLFPIWLSVAVNTGELGPGAQQSFNVFVARANLPVGSSAHTFQVVGSNGDTRNVTVTAVAP